MVKATATNRIKGRASKTLGGKKEDAQGNGAEYSVQLLKPYTVEMIIRGVCDMLFHAYNVEDVAAKTAAKRGDAIKKQDNVEAYVYRDKEGFIVLPGRYVHGAMCNAARRKQDPSSARKSALDLFKAGIFPEGDARIMVGTKAAKTWDQLDTQRVVVNHSAVPRTRPMFYAGWSASVRFNVPMPELISPDFFREVAEMAGKFVGVADFRPQYGRFQIDGFKVIKG